MSTFQRPSSQETELIGHWLWSAGEIKADDVCQRIEYLINDVFNRLVVDASGWLILYQDPSDGRYWELSYPNSGESGGGPPTLRMVTSTDVKRKFAIT